MNAYALTCREPWAGLPGDDWRGERISQLHREIEEYRRQKEDLESDWDEARGYIKGLDLLSQVRVKDIFDEAIRDKEYEIRDRLTEIEDIKDGAYET